MVWQNSRKLVKQIYDLTGKFPLEEKFGLANQIQRAAVSIPSNIAEGYGRNSDKEMIRFLSIAKGSLYESGNTIVYSNRSKLPFRKRNTTGYGTV